MKKYILLVSAISAFIPFISLESQSGLKNKAGVGGILTLAGLYDLLAPREKKDFGEEVWNRAKIVVNGNKVQHWLNGQLTVEYERGNTAWKELVAKSKFKDLEGFGEVEEGRILLQDHGNIVAFKNIKIREIK
jgi:hypothetical protein